MAKLTSRISLDFEDYSKLQEFATRLGRTVGDIFDEAAREYIDWHRESSEPPPSEAR